MDVPEYNPEQINVARTHSAEIKNPPTMWEQFTSILERMGTNARWRSKELAQTLENFVGQPTIDSRGLSGKPGISQKDLVHRINMEQAQRRMIEANKSRELLDNWLKQNGDYRK